MIPDCTHYTGYLLYTNDHSVQSVINFVVLIHLTKKIMATVQWVLDPSHSEIQFKVKHLMISKVTGEFTKFSGSFSTQGEDISTANISFKADIGSISTNNEQRDSHLKSSDFFEADKHPELLFESEKL